MIPMKEDDVQLFLMIVERIVIAGRADSDEVILPKVIGQYLAQEYQIDLQGDVKEQLVPYFDELVRMLGGDPDQLRAENRGQVC